MGNGYNEWRCGGVIAFDDRMPKNWLTFSVSQYVRDVCESKCPHNEADVIHLTLVGNWFAGTWREGMASACRSCTAIGNTARVIALCSLPVSSEID